MAAPDQQGRSPARKEVQPSSQKPLPHTVKSKRAGKPKVKTGCQTCKARRVKCDEAKPFCKRCLRFGVVCDGYAPSTKATKPARTTRVIISKPQRRPPQLFEVLPTYKIRSGPRFEDEQEGQCFRIYCEQMASHMQGPFKSGTLWDRLIPQTSEAEPFIRHAIIAIGAMGKIQQDEKLSKIAPTKALDYAFALNQFDKALRGMRMAIANGDTDIRKALIACILVFCFETLSGKPGSAVLNAESGLMMLHQWMKSNVSQGDTFFMNRECQEQYLEEDLISAFGSLDLQVLIYLDARAPETKKFMVEGGSKAIKRMPPVFSSLKMARDFWYLIMRRNYHFIKLALLNGKPELYCGPWKYDSNAPWGDSANIFPGGNMFCTPYEPVLEMIAEALSYREDIKRWSQAAAPVFKNISTTGTEEEKVVVALLRVHRMMNEIMLQSSFFDNEVAYDRFIPEFKRMIFLIHYIHPHTAMTSAPYHFDLGIIAPLLFVALRCRDKTIREDAIAISQKVHYREGVWDSVAVVSYMQWIGEIEDAGRDKNGFVPEDKRAFMTGTYLDLYKKRAIAHATQNRKSPVFLEKMVSWA